MGAGSPTALLVAGIIGHCHHMGRDCAGSAAVGAGQFGLTLADSAATPQWLGLQSATYSTRSDCPRRTEALADIWCVCVRACVRAAVCVRVCVCARARARVCVCVWRA